jgi:ketosteroid isomerase-like protein
MKNFNLSAIVVIGIIAVATPAFSQSKQNATMTTFEKEALDTHKNLNNLMVHGDTAALKKLYTDSYTLTNAYEQVWTRSFFIGLISNGSLKMQQLMASDEKIKLVGNVAIFTARQDFKLQFGGNPMEGKERTTAVYEKKNGKWLLTAQQNTPIVE